MREPIIVPAETAQAEVAEPCRTPFHIWALWVVTIALVGAHPIWVRAGMPMPAEILARLTEILNV